MSKMRGIYTTHKYIINIDTWESKPIYLVPIGDVHRFSPLCAVERWNNFLDWARSKNSYFIGVGDYLDLISTSERKSLAISDFHDSTIDNLEEMCDKQIDEFCEEISFMKGRTVGLIEGNHYFKYQSGMTSDEKMCEKLKCKFLGTCAFVRLIIRDKAGHSAALDIYIHHGEGGGRTIGASAGKLERTMKGKRADIYIMGHDHNKWVVPKSVLELSDSRKTPQLIHKKVLMMRSGSFLRGYVNGKRSYVAAGNYNPAELGVVKIEITPRRDKDDNRYLDLHASV